MTKSTLFQTYLSMIRNAIENQDPVDKHWLGKDGFDNFYEDMSEELTEAKKHNKDKQVIDHRQKGLTSLVRLQTKDGSYTKANMVPFIAAKEINITKCCDEDDLGLHRTDQPIHADWGENQQTADCKVVKGDDPSLPPTLRRYEYNGRMYSLKEAIRYNNLPVEEVRNLMESDYNLTIKEAGEKLLKQKAEKMVDLDGEKVSLPKAASKLSSKEEFNKLSSSFILGVIENKDMDWDKAKTSLNIAQGKRSPVWVWTYDTDTKALRRSKYPSKQEASNRLGITVQTIYKKIHTGNATNDDLYFTDDKQPPTELEPIFNLRLEMTKLFKVLTPILEFSLSRKQTEVLFERLAKSQTYTKVAEITNLTESQVRRFMAKTFKDLKEGQDIAVRPITGENPETEAPETTDDASNGIARFTDEMYGKLSTEDNPWTDYIDKEKASEESNNSNIFDN